MANVNLDPKGLASNVQDTVGHTRIYAIEVTPDTFRKAGTLGEDDTVTVRIPVEANSTVVEVSAVLLEAFAGSGDQLNLIAGLTGGDTDGFLEAAALHDSQTEITAPVINTGAFFNDSTTDNVINGKTFAAADTVDFVFNGAAGAAINLGSLTAGKVVLKVRSHLLA